MAESTRVRIAPPITPIPLAWRDIRVDDADDNVPLVTLAPEIAGCIQTNEDGSISFRLMPDASGALVKALLASADLRDVTVIAIYGQKIDVRVVDK